MNPCSAPSHPLLPAGCSPLHFPAPALGLWGLSGQEYSLKLVLFTTHLPVASPAETIKAAVLSEQQGVLAILGPLERVNKPLYLCAAASKVTLLEARPAFPPVKPNPGRGAAMRLLRGVNTCQDRIQRAARASSSWDQALSLPPGVGGSGLPVSIYKRNPVPSCVGEQ